MKKTVLCVHGALGCARSFEDWIRWSKENDAAWFEQFDWHFLDLDGHGRNDKRVDFSLEYFVENVGEYLQSVSGTACYILGYSMGGYIALDFAVSHPEAIRSIVTLGTKFDWNPATSEREVHFLNPTLIQEKVPAYADQLQGYHGKDRWERVLEQTREMMLRLGAQDRIGKESWCNVEVPVTLLRAENDSMVTDAETDYVARQLLPRAEKHTIPGKHGLDTINYARLNEVLKETWG